MNAQQIILTEASDKLEEYSLSNPLFEGLLDVLTQFANSEPDADLAINQLINAADALNALAETIKIEKAISDNEPALVDTALRQEKTLDV
jgi:hypothetical protein